MAAFLLSKFAHDVGDPRDSATAARAKPEPTAARPTVHGSGSDAASTAATGAEAVGPDQPARPADLPRPSATQQDHPTRTDGLPRRRCGALLPAVSAGPGRPLGVGGRARNN